MARQLLKYFLFNSRNKPLYRDGTAIKEGDENYKRGDGNSAALDFAPEGWRDTMIRYARNVKYWGMFRSFTVPMKFVKDGAAILQAQQWAEGYEAVTRLGILRMDDNALPYTYKKWYLGDINHVKYKETEDSITAEIIEGGLSKYIKAYENTVYEIPLSTDPERVLVLMDGMELANNGTFTITNGISIDPNADYGNHLIALDIIEKEVEDIGGINSVPRTKVPNLNPNIRATGQYVFKATIDVTLTIEYDFTLYVEAPATPINPAAVLNVVARVINPADNVADPALQKTLFQVGAAGAIGTHKITGKQTMTVPEGRELYLLTFLTVEGAGGGDTTIFQYTQDNATFKITYTYRHPESTIVGLTPYRLFERLINKMTDGKFTVKSDMLRKMDDIVLTSGDAVRGNYPNVIRTSFSDFFKWTGFFSTGFGIENDVAVIEPLAYFFKNTVAMNLGEVADAEITPAEDLLFNTIKAGYKTQEYKDINGKFEVNQQQQWTTSVKSLTKELDLTSPYRADPYGIELLRMNFGQQKTTDTGADNDVCVLHVKTETQTLAGIAAIFTEPNYLFIPYTYQLRRGDVITIAGSANNNQRFTVVAVDRVLMFRRLTLAEPVVAEPNATISLNVVKGLRRLFRPVLAGVVGVLYPASIFNVLLSPKIGILNNGALLHSLLDRMEAEYITYQTTDKNAALAYTYNGNQHTENANIQISTLPAKLFQPYYITFRATGFNIEALNANQYGRVEFKWNGLTWYGFLVDGGIKEATNESAEFKLLATPNNDLKKFNRYG